MGISEKRALADRLAERTDTFNGGGAIDWTMHASANATDPDIADLVLCEGMAGYGRYSRLIELTALAPAHTIPCEGDREHPRWMKRLGFTDPQAFEQFLSTLQDFGLIDEEDCGLRFVPLVDEAAARIGKKRSDGSKGGFKARDNRRKGL